MAQVSFSQVKNYILRERQQIPHPKSNEIFAAYESLYTCNFSFIIYSKFLITSKKIIPRKNTAVWWMKILIYLTTALVYYKCHIFLFICFLFLPFTLLHTSNCRSLSSQFTKCLSISVCIHINFFSKFKMLRWKVTVFDLWRWDFSHFIQKGVGIWCIHIRPSLCKRCSLTNCSKMHLNSMQV